MRPFALLSLLLLAACAQPTTFAPTLTEQELAAEEAIQQRMLAEAAQKGGVPRPWRKHKGVSGQFERVADKIDKSGANLCQEIGLPQQGKRCYYYFKLATTRDELNSHADGKTVVIYNGMMKFLQDDDEVAIIMAHELAHNMMSHVEATRQNVLAGAFVGAMIDGAGKFGKIDTGGSWVNTGADIGRLSYSVEFEQEADYVGLYIAARAGYDVRKAPGVWRRMTLEDPEGLFREVTHPANPKRAALLQKAVYEIEYKRKHAIPLVPDFKSSH